MNKVSKIFLASFCLVITLLYNLSLVNAADDEKPPVKGSVGLSVSSSSVTIGNSVTVTVSASCEDSAGGIVTIGFDYNSSYLKLTNYPSGDYNSGTLIMDFSGSRSTSRSFTFQTIGSGQTTVSLWVKEFYCYGDNANVVGYSSQSRTININQKTTGGGGTSSNTGGGYGGGSNTSTPALSADATVASIVVEGQELMPKFSSDVTEYKLYLPKGTTTLKVNAKAASSKSKIETINSEVKPGWNDIKVTCTAENKSQKTYTLKAYVEEEPDRFFKLNDTELGIVKNLDLVEPLEGFEKVEIEANIEGVDGKVPLTIFKGGYFNLLYLENQEGEKDFYLYKRFKNEIVGKFHMFLLGDKKFVETDFEFDENHELANLFQLGEFDLEDGSTIKCLDYKASNMKDFKLFYLTNEDGQKSWYQLDKKENTIQRYVVPEKEVVEEKVDYTEYAYMALGGLGVLSTLLAILSVRRTKMKYEHYSN